MFVCLDFDGVIADGVDECLIVSWLAWNQQPIPDDPEQLFTSIPADFRLYFKQLRRYVRHDEHFVAAYYIPATNPVHSQQDFDRHFNEFDHAIVKPFTLRFRQLRKELRQQHPRAWLGLHSLYAGIQGIFADHADIFIVSGKDSESIAAICKEHHIPVDKNKVYGGLSSKVDVLNKLFTRAKQQHRQMIFCDDNLPNVFESRNIGITTYWAGWGYHTEEHVESAANNEINLITLAKFRSQLNQFKEND